jgi:hypothetical protein
MKKNLTERTFIKPPPAEQILEAMREPLSLWFGQNRVDLWFQRIGSLPACNSLFLEIFTNSSSPRCDIITGVEATDGSLSLLLDGSIVRTTEAWRNTLSLLGQWRQQFHKGNGFLRTQCYTMWLEFDIKESEQCIDGPSVFIALTPGSKIGDLVHSLSDYLDFQQAIYTNYELVEKERNDDELVLGHIGYMAARRTVGEILPLRTCWRCKNIQHAFQLLRRACIPFDGKVIEKQIYWLDDLYEFVNSILLDLDINTKFQVDFALEFNFFRPYEKPSNNEILLNKLIELKLLTKDQKEKLAGFSDTFLLSDGRSLDCLLHHMKLKFSNSKIQDVKYYWKAVIIRNKQ